MDPKEAECHYMGTPFGPSAASAATGSDAAAIKHDRHIVGSFRLTGLTGHHRGTQMEALQKETITERQQELVGQRKEMSLSSMLYFPEVLSLTLIYFASILYL